MCDDKMWSLFGGLPESKKKRFPLGSIFDYYDFLKTIDIGIAPLGKTEFNRGRSDIKFLEYAVHGVVPVVQSSPPYLGVVRHGETGFLFNSPGEMVGMLDAVALNFDLRARVAAAARQYVLDERRLRRRAGEVVAFYREHLGKTRGAAAVAGFFDKCSTLEGAVKTGRCINLAPSRHDLAVPLAFVCANTGRKAELAALLNEIEAADPGGCLTPLLKGAFLAETFEERISLLEEALARNPRSINTLIKLGMNYFEAGLPEKALERFLGALRLFPEFMIPNLCCGRVLEAMGEPAKAKKFFDKAKSL
jgi:tetratricopeptide (TPR) repeat protein